MYILSHIIIRTKVWQGAKDDGQYEGQFLKAIIHMLKLSMVYLILSQAPTSDGKIPWRGGNADPRRRNAHLSDAILMPTEVSQVVVVNEVPRVNGWIVTGAKQ